MGLALTKMNSCFWIRLSRLAFGWFWSFPLVDSPCIWGKDWWIPDDLISLDLTFWKELHEGKCWIQVILQVSTLNFNLPLLFQRPNHKFVFLCWKFSRRMNLVWRHFLLPRLYFSSSIRPPSYVFDRTDLKYVLVIWRLGLKPCSLDWWKSFWAQLWLDHLQLCFF